MQFLKTLFLASAVATVVASTSSAQTAAHTQPSSGVAVVLVHGAFADGSSRSSHCCRRRA